MSKKKTIYQFRNPKTGKIALYSDSKKLAVFTSATHPYVFAVIAKEYPHTAMEDIVFKAYDLREEDQDMKFPDTIFGFPSGYVHPYVDLSELEARDPVKLGIPNINFSCAVTRREDDRYERCLRERVERGFDYSETWNLDHTLCAFLAPRLAEFIYQTKDRIRREPEEWQELEQLQKDLEARADGYEPTYGDDGSPERAEHDRFYNFPNILAKYFFSLWW